MSSASPMNSWRISTMVRTSSTLIELCSVVTTVLRLLDLASLVCVDTTISLSPQRSWRTAAPMAA